MIPLHDDNPTRRVPWMTLALIAANVAMFGYQWMLLAEGRLETFVQTAAFVPARFLADPFSPAQIGTIFTAMFMHAGLLHLGGNMLYLWIFGNNVEDRLGRFGFLAFYLVAGVLATFGQMLVSPASNIPNLGASGAVAGVLGAYLLLFPRARVLTAVVVVLFIELVRIPALIVIGFWFVLQLLSGIASLGPAETAGGVAYFAHLGGFVAGLLMALPLKFGGSGRGTRFATWR